MRTHLPVAIAIVLITAGSAVAASVEPTTITVVPSSSVIGFDEGFSTATGELVRVYANDLSVTTCAVGDALECGQPKAIDWLGSGPGVFFLTSAHVGRRHTVLSDACNGRIIQLSGNALLGFNATEIVDEFGDANGGFSALERPAATLAVGDQLFFTEGRLAESAAPSPDCSIPGAIGPPHGALVQVEDPFVVVVDPLDEGRGEYDQTVLVAASDDPYAFHPQASKGMTVYTDGELSTPEFWAVSGWTTREEALLTWPHIQRWQTHTTGPATRIGDVIDLPFQVLSQPAAVPWGIGEPRFITPLRYERDPPLIVVGGPLGLVAFSLEGRYLGPLWLATDRMGPLDPAIELVSLAGAPDGSRIVALFRTGDKDQDELGNRGTLLAMWDAEDIEAQLIERVIEVEPGDVPVCNREEDGLRCFSVQAGVARAWDEDTVAVAEGFYTDAIHAFDRRFDIVAEPPGQAVISHPDGDGSVVFVDSVDHGTMVVDGFVLTGGEGTPADLGVGVLRYGGGLLAVGSHVRLKRTLVAHNHADLGGGIAFGGPGAELHLENVGLVDNHGNFGGAIVASGTDSDRAYVSMDRTTVAGNCSDTEGVGLGHFTDVALSIDTSIAGFNDDTDLPPRVGSSSADVDRTDLYFEEPLDPDTLDALGVDNMSVDPRFEDLSARDLRLLPDTPATLDGEELGLYGGEAAEGLQFPGLPPEVVDYCDLPGGDDDDDDDDDDDSTDDDDSAGPGGDEQILPSGLRCDDCGASMTAADASTPLLLAPLLALRRRRSR